MNLSKNSSVSNFVKLIEASLTELFELSEVVKGDSLSSFYHKVLINYLSGNPDLLRDLISSKKNEMANVESIEWKAAFIVSELRLILLEKVTLVKWSVEEIRQKEAELGSSLWNGECYFVLARMLDIKGQHADARLYYLKARDYFEAIGACKKAIKASFNAIICRERIDDSDGLHYQYVDLISKARKTGEYCVVGMAMLALSQKLMDVGALRTALEYGQRALSFLSREKGSLNYFKALLNRSYLFFLLGYFEKSKADYQEAKLSTHVEIANAIAVLETKVNFETVILNNSVLPFSWWSRIHYEKENLPLLGRQEEQLISLLLKRPHSKKAVLNKIWNEEVEAEYIDLRFKKLMWRLRQKFPDMIRLESGLYCISSLRKNA